MARHEKISVNFFDSLLCSKRFRKFFFFAQQDQQVVSVWVTSSPNADLFTYPGHHTLG